MYRPMERRCKYAQILRLIPLLASLFIWGCSESDDNEPWLGEWAVESIDGVSVQEILVGSAPEATVDTVNRMTFTESGSWFWTFGSDFDSQGQDGTVDRLEISIGIQGIYAVDTSRFALDARTVTVSLRPPDIWKEEIGITEIEVENSIKTNFATRNVGSWRIESGTLILAGDVNLWRFTPF